MFNKTMRQNLLLDICTLWLLIPMIEMERMEKAPTDPCTLEEFQEIMQACREYKKKGKRTDLGYELIIAINKSRHIKSFSSLFNGMRKVGDS